MKFKRSEKIYPAETRPIQCHNCPRQFKNFHSLTQHRRPSIIKAIAENSFASPDL